MDPQEAWSSAASRAWMVGIALGMIGGLASGVMGLFSSVCCLFQFINLIGPALAGLVGGLGAAAMAPWGEMDGQNNLGKGAGLGARAGILAACGSGLLGFLAAMLYPLAYAMYIAYTNGNDIAVALTASAMTLVWSAIWSAAFTGGGALLGSVLGVAGGAVMGAIR